MSNQSVKPSLETIVALCKRRGFVYPSAEIYGGVNGVYDFGPLGSLMKQHIRKFWTDHIRKETDNIVFLEGPILAPTPVWKASGHLENFHDPMVDCLECKKRFRSDELDLEKPCPSCGKHNWTEARQFNLMFKTAMGAMADQTSDAYLRPETAQAIFINFKNVYSTSRVKIPFGIAQIGKAFRNEITPKQYLFRTREFEQMEIEWFCKDENRKKFFEFWLEARHKFYQEIGLKDENYRFDAHKPEDLSHYSSATTDVEYHFPFGWKELEGIADRGNYDLSQHTKHSGKDLAVFDEETKESYIPSVVECSVGVDRLFLALMCDAYAEEEVDGETRVLLKLNPAIAPITAAIIPLSKKLSEPAKKIYNSLKFKFSVQYDESGSIGKRYRRQDEIGTPLCFTYDFESEDDNMVTVRERDTTKQTRIPIDSIEEYIVNTLKKS
ncbi:glycine--tRNA ligase [bacterium]|jgi:glycyl-tRNA synthetase|nr:glycine--tRNA ligase [bacterium]MBT5015337.1 glycine--tRNA ligase [bacterium]